MLEHTSSFFILTVVFSFSRVTGLMTASKGSNVLSGDTDCENRYNYDIKYVHRLLFELL